MTRQEAIEVLKERYLTCIGIGLDNHANRVNEAIDMAIEALQDDWIPVSERLPECEQEVLICTETKFVGKNAYVDSIVTPAFYEDGTMLETESKWLWEMDGCANWSEESDCYLVPEGWWENRHFCSDDTLSLVDNKVIAWMPLPEPYKGGDDNE